MISVSLCMIVKDEEAVLGRCLASIAEGVEEIIIADTGSQDRTKEIAASFGAKVYDFKWIDDFAAARNFSFSKATKDYILWLDADDLLDEEALRKFLELKRSLSTDTDMVYLEYWMGPKEDPLSFFFYRERLLKRASGFRWEGAVHEAIAPRGKILYSPIPIFHRKVQVRDAARNLRIYEGKIAKGCNFTPRERYYYARELADHRRYSEASCALEAALEENLWVEDRLGALQLLSYCKKALGDFEGALEPLLSALSLGVPRGELCCALGDHFLEAGKEEVAAFWYQAAMDRPLPSQGFILRDRYGVYPALQLCLCAWRQGHLEEAKAWNERAAILAPSDPRVLYNQAFFEEKG